MHGPADEASLYALLGVDESTPWDEVRRAFRAAVRASHPDLHVDDPEAERRLKTLIAAWESVNTPERWAAYVLTPAAVGAPRTGRLRIRRQLRGSIGLSNWRLELDGTVVASIENGGESVLEAAPGPHSLRVFYGSCSSLPLALHVQRGHELSLGCRQLESLRVRLLSPRRSLVLERLGSRRLDG